MAEIISNMDETDVKTWLGNYINFFGDGTQMPKPEDFSNFNSSLKPTIDSTISSLKGFLAVIPDDQLLALMQETVTDNKGVVHYPVAEAFITAITAAPYWFWYRLNVTMRAMAQPADLINYFIGSYNTAYAISSTWATVKKQQTGDPFDMVLTTLSTWNTGSQAVIEAMAKDSQGNPVFKNCISMADILNNMKASLQLTDGSDGSGVPDAQPSYLNNIVNGLYFLGGL